MTTQSGTGNPETFLFFSALYAPHVGGVERYTAGLAHELAARGARVIVATSRLSEEDAEFEVQDDGVEIARLPCQPLLGGRLPIPIHDRRHGELLAYLGRQRPRRIVVNTRFYGHSLDGARFAAREGTPALVIEHGSAHLSLGNRLADLAVERYEHAVTEKMKSFGFPFYAVSRKACDWLGHFGIRAAGVIPNAFEMGTSPSEDSAQKYRESLGVSDRDVLVAVVGRLVPEKGIGAVCESARIFARDAAGDRALPFHGDGRVVFAVAGDGPLRKLLEDAPDNVMPLGQLSQSEVSTLMRASDVYLLPSRSEGFPTTLLEAVNASAFPMVTDVGAVEELALGDVGGIVLEDASPVEIVAAIAVYAEHREECEAQAMALHERALARNTWKNSAEALLKAFGD